MKKVLLLVIVAGIIGWLLGGAIFRTRTEPVVEFGPIIDYAPRGAKAGSSK